MILFYYLKFQKKKKKKKNNLKDQETKTDSFRTEARNNILFVEGTEMLYLTKSWRVALREKCPNPGKYGSEKPRIRVFLMQC